MLVLGFRFRHIHLAKSLGDPRAVEVAAIRERSVEEVQSGCGVGEAVAAAALDSLLLRAVSASGVSTRCCECLALLGSRAAGHAVGMTPA